MTGTGGNPGVHPTPPYGEQPAAGWPAAPPARRTGKVVAIVVIVGAVLVVSCLGLAGGVYYLLRSDNTAAPGPVTGAPSVPGTTGSPGPRESEEPVRDGPQASAYPAAEISDLDRVCDENVYYPAAPKRAGKAPHPVVLLVSDSPGIRYQDTGYFYPLGLSKKVEQSWASKNPRKVQMVACLDKVKAGSKIRNCSYDKPKPQKATLLRAGWRLRVYEVATGRKLLDKAMPGDDQRCPLVVLVGPDKKIYADVSDRAVIAALRNLVTK